jgi:hypothetical protein
MALLLQRPGGEVVQAAIFDYEAVAYAHRINLVEVFYNMHQRGAMAAYLARHPQARIPGDPGKPDMTGIDVFDPTIFNPHDGERDAQIAMETLANTGIHFVETMDANLWQDAARLKSQFRRVSLADCFGVALARRLDAEFLTSDRHELEALEAAGIANFTFIR